MRTPTTGKAFAYLRVSGQAQLTNGSGLDRQEETIKAYAKAHDLRIMRTYREQISGDADLSDREMLGSILHTMAQTGTDILIGESWSRLSRDLIQRELYIKALDAAGLTVVSATEPAASTDEATRTLIRCVLGAVWQFEKGRLVEKLRIARVHAKAKTGRGEGQKPWGFYTGEQATLERTLALRTGGMGYQRIADTLEPEKRSTRKPGARWYASSCRKF